MNIHFFEIIGFVTGILSVWLNGREKIEGWPLGLISVLFYGVVFFRYELYADMLLQIIYVPLCLYGWYNWNKQQGNYLPKITSINPATLGRLAFSLIIITSIIGVLMQKYTEPKFGFLDVAASGLSLLAEWMLGKKIIESWLVWIMADGCFALLYSMKGLYLTAFLYTLFVLLAVEGYRKWKSMIAA